MRDIYLKQSRSSYSISAENMTGERNSGCLAIDGTGVQAARDLEKKWKISPSIKLQCNELKTIANISGEGMITSIWMTHIMDPRSIILRFYWDTNEYPSIEVPLDDFFACGNGEYAQISGFTVNVNPSRGYNCFWKMPFHSNCKITVENIGRKEELLFYQINYEIGEIEKDCLYFHAQFHRENPVHKLQEYTLLNLPTGEGQYVGTYMLWQVNNNLWWGEGEVHFFIDGEKNPSLCGTGTEDYFGGAWNFENPNTKAYQDFSTPYYGFHQYKPDGVYKANTRFNLYRFHILDPIIYKSGIKVTVQDLGWRNDFDRYLPLQDDISSVAYWYSSTPQDVTGNISNFDELEII